MNITGTQAGPNASEIEAVKREHNMRHWKRAWKTTLVDAMNPEWVDLYPTLF